LDPHPVRRLPCAGTADDDGVGQAPLEQVGQLVFDRSLDQGMAVLDPEVGPDFD